MDNKHEYFRRNKNQDPFTIREGKFSFASLEDSSYHQNWAEESFLAGQGEKEMLRGSFSAKKLIYFSIFIGVLMVILLSRLFWLQIIKSSYYYSMAEGNRLRIESIEPKRGIIYDRNHQPLLRNEANLVVYVLPIDLPSNRDVVLEKLAMILAPQMATTTSADFKQQVDKIGTKSLEAYRPLFLAANITSDQAMELTLKAGDLPGVFLTSKIRRSYNQVVQSLSHVLGYTGKISESEYQKLKADYTPIDYIGKTGLEDTYEQELKGKKGKRSIEVDAFGREKKVVGYESPQDGSDITLYLDLNLQTIAEEALRKELKKIGLQRGSVAIIDVKTGGILALISLPAYDANAFAKGISQADYQKIMDDKNQPLFNRVISGSFPSGSVFKPIMAAAALNEKLIDRNTTFLSNGGLQLGQWFFPDWKAGGHGMTNVTKAIAESVNTFFYYIGGGYDTFSGLGPNLIKKYADLFGLGELTGIDLPNEAKGFIPDPDWKLKTTGEKWYVGDTYNFSIGQGYVLTTPLQVANYTAAIANGGKLLKPKLVQNIGSQPEVIRENFVTPENLSIVREGMRQTILAGSARSLQSVPVAVAGKTGTAQWSSKYNYQAWFTGFAPYEDPQIAITVMIEEGGEGSSVAVPVANEILSWYFRKQDP